MYTVHSLLIILLLPSLSKSACTYKPTFTCILYSFSRAPNALDHSCCCCPQPAGYLWGSIGSHHCSGAAKKEENTAYRCVKHAATTSYSMFGVVSMNRDLAQVL